MSDDDDDFTETAPVGSGKKKCVYPTCPANIAEIRSNLHFNFFAPRTEAERVKWEKSLQMKISMRTKLCELHFDEGKLFQNASNAKKKQLLPHAMPFPMTSHSPFHQETWDRKSQKQKNDLVQSLFSVENRCAVKSCPNSEKAADYTVALFKARSTREKEKWSRILSTNLTTLCFVCHLHFNDNDLFDKNRSGRIVLKEGALPNNKEQRSHEDSNSDGDVDMPIKEETHPPEITEEGGVIKITPRKVTTKSYLTSFTPDDAEPEAPDESMPN